MHDLTLANEADATDAVHSFGAAPGGASRLPPRQNRRTPLIEAALAPVASNSASARELLTHALAMVIGTEAIIVVKDVLQLEDAEARKVKRWAIRALVEAARRPGGG